MQEAKFDVFLSVRYDTGMGKRKLRFDQRKNYERKKNQAVALTISLPLSLYKSLPTTSPITLFTRLRSTGSLGNGWMTTDQPIDDPALSVSQSCVLYKMSLHRSLPFVLFTLTVNNDSTWTLMVCESQVKIEQSSLFSEVPHYLRSVDDVVGLLSMLNQSKFCIGNKDTKFLELATANGGVFKDKRGNY